ncbi:MAG: T9SS type A sorting domain-containing protein, partial [Bacteroidetes bacterium]|nr:T9SS type A sorting domain-containing protein [Bacteroidota bacterium]
TTATSNSITMSVTSTVTPSVSIALTSGTNPTCSGSAVTFTATPTNGGTTPAYQWKKGGTNITGATTSTYSYTPANGDAITCVLTSNATCASPTTATSNSIAMSVTSTVTPTVSIALTTGTNPTCSGSAVTFTATQTNGGASPTYQWKKGGINIAGATASTYSYTPANGDAITCDLTSDLSCASPTNATSNIINMTVNPLPLTAEITQTAVDVLTASVSGTSYQWYLNGALISGNTQSITVTQEGTYTVIVIDNNDCQSITSEGFEYTTTGIFVITEDNLIIYPNPSMDFFTIKYVSSLSGDLKISIINTLGETIYYKELMESNNSFTEKINLSNYAGGVYYITISDGDKTIQRKLIKL